MIIGIDEWRAGDTATGEHRSHDAWYPFSATIRIDEDGDAWAAGLLLRYEGRLASDVRAVSVSRTTLPTEPGTPITDVTLVNGHFIPQLVRDSEGDWQDMTRLWGARRFYFDQDIVSFTLAKVVPA